MTGNELIELPDGALDGTRILESRQLIESLLGLPMKCSGSVIPELDLPKAIAYKSDGIPFRYHRPEDTSYLPGLLKRRSGPVGVDYVTSNRTLRLLFELNGDSIVLANIEHHPRRTTAPSA